MELITFEQAKKLKEEGVSHKSVSGKYYFQSESDKKVQLLSKGVRVKTSGEYYTAYTIEEFEGDNDKEPTTKEEFMMINHKLDIIYKLLKEQQGVNCRNKEERIK